MDLPPKAGGRRRARRLWASLGAALVVVAGWAAAPRVEDRARRLLAERAIADGRLDDASAQLDLLIARRPARAWPRFLRARVARLQGEITEAEEILQRAIELGLPVEQARGEHDLLVDSERSARSGQRSAVRIQRSAGGESAPPLVRPDHR